MKIEKIKKVGKKYKIEFDNNEKITTYDDVIITNGLLFHPNIDSNILNKITIDHNYYDIYYKVINYITRKLRSEKEINIFIDKYSINEIDKNKIIIKLKDIGLINDNNFVKAYVSDKIHLSSDGPNKIIKDLLQHDIDENIIIEEINKIDKELITDKINKIVNKKIKNTKYSGYYLKQKILNEMNNLGYDKEAVLFVLANINKDDSSLLKKEYDKLYKKLSAKYQDKELNNKIRQKLYQKGFKLEDIDNI